MLNKDKYKKILCIDDDINILTALERMLNKPHIEVITASDVDMGIEMARKKLPDLVILDINMASTSGFDFFEKRKAEALLSNINVIMLSSDISKDNIVKSKEYGAIDFVTKPFNVYDLTKRINKIFLKNKMLKIHNKSQQACVEFPIEIPYFKLGTSSHILGILGPVKLMEQTTIKLVDRISQTENNYVSFTNTNKSKKEFINLCKLRGDNNLYLSTSEIIASFEENNLIEKVKNIIIFCDTKITKKTHNNLKILESFFKRKAAQVQYITLGEKAFKNIYPKEYDLSIFVRGINSITTIQAKIDAILNTTKKSPLLIYADDELDQDFIIKENDFFMDLINHPLSKNEILSKIAYLTANPWDIYKFNALFSSRETSRSFSLISTCQVMAISKAYLSVACDFYICINTIVSMKIPLEILDTDENKITCRVIASSFKKLSQKYHLELEILHTTDFNKGKLLNYFLESKDYQLKKNKT